MDLGPSGEACAGTPTGTTPGVFGRDLSIVDARRAQEYWYSGPRPLPGSPETGLACDGPTRGRRPATVA